MTTETAEKLHTPTVTGNAAPLAHLPPPGSSGYMAFKPFEIDAELRTLLKKMYAPQGCTDLELDFFFAYCLRTGLDPVLKQAYLVKRSVQVKTAQGEQWVDKWEPMSSEAGMAAKADGLPDFRGMLDGVVYENDVFEMDNVAQTVVHKSAHPSKRGKMVGAWAHVQREGRKVPITFLTLGERIQTKRDGTPTQFWAKMAPGQLLKCCRAEQWRQGWPNIFGGQYVAEEMSTHEEIDVTPPGSGADAAKANRDTTDKLTENLKGAAKKITCSEGNHYTAAGAATCQCGAVKADAPPASKSTVDVKTEEKPLEKKKPERKTSVDVVEEQRADMLADIVEGADKAAEKSNVVPITSGAKPADPAPASEKLPHEVADAKKAAAAADTRPRMVFGKEHKDKVIEELDGPTILDLMKRGNAQLGSLDDEKKKAKVVLNLTQLKEELDRREARMMAEQEKAQNAAPAREPGSDDVE